MGNQVPLNELVSDNRMHTRSLPIQKPRLIVPQKNTRPVLITPSYLIAKRGSQC